MAVEKSILVGTQKTEAVKLIIQALQAAPGAIKPGQSGKDFADGPYRRC